MLNADYPVCFYADLWESESFDVGFLIGLDDAFALFNGVTQEGVEDGFTLILRDNIYRVDSQAQYLIKIVTLWNRKNQKKNTAFIPKDDFLYELLDYARRSKTFVSLFLFDGVSAALYGRVRHLDEETVVLDAIDQFGNHDGEVIMDLSSILMLRCDSGFEKDLGIVYNIRNELLE